MTDTLKIGTRGSKLAMWQAQWVKDSLRKNGWTGEIELVTIHTKGDKILDSPLAKVGGKGLFVKEIEEALIRNEIDLAVHSMKDVPTKLIEGLIIGAVTAREDPRDVLVSKEERILKHLPDDAVVGTSSLRRQSQILHHFPRFQIVQIRGNVETRLRRIEGTDGLDAVIVAAAGLNRLGLYNKVTEYLPAEICLPAIGQGALGIEVREEDSRVKALVQALNDPNTSTAIAAERAFLNRLGGSCQIPIAGFAGIQGNELLLEGMVASLDGVRMIRDKISGTEKNAKELGIRLAEQLLAEGAAEVLDEIISKTNLNDK
ncbi:MAG: hydroxymethylbilane synthase [bacterium]